MTDALKNRHLCHSTQPERVLRGRGKHFHELCNYVTATLTQYPTANIPHLQPQLKVPLISIYVFLILTKHYTVNFVKYTIIITYNTQNLHMYV